MSEHPARVSGSVEHLGDGCQRSTAWSALGCGLSFAALGCARRARPPWERQAARVSEELLAPGCRPPPKGNLKQAGEKIKDALK